MLNETLSFSRFLFLFLFLSLSLSSLYEPQPQLSISEYWKSENAPFASLSPSLSFSLSFSLVPSPRRDLYPCSLLNQLRDWTARARAERSEVWRRSISQEFNKEPVRSLCSEQSCNVFSGKEKRASSGRERLGILQRIIRAQVIHRRNNEKWLLISPTSIPRSRSLRAINAREYRR